MDDNKETLDIIDETLSPEESVSEQDEPASEDDLSDVSASDGESASEDDLSDASASDGEPTSEDGLSDASVSDGEPASEDDLSDASASDGEPASEGGFYDVAVSDEEADEEFGQSKTGTKISAIIIASFALLGVIALVIILVTVMKTRDEDDKSSDAVPSGTVMATDPATVTDTVAPTSDPSSESSTDSASASSDTELPIDYVDYGVTVTLGDYKNLTLSVAESSVTDEEVEAEIEDFIDSHRSMRDVTDRAVQSGDTVSIDFDGIVDGEHHDSTTGTDFTVIIGSHSTINGFEDGIIGLKIGETTVLNLVFPENYRDADFAGKPVDFTITVNSIQEEYIPELTDEFVAENTDQKTVAEYREATRANLLSQKELTAKNEAFETALNDFINTCTFSDEIENEIKDRMEYYRKYFDSYYTQAFGVDTQTYMGATDEEFETVLRQYSEPDIKLPYVLRAIAEEEGYTPTDEEKAKRFDEIFYDIYGFESEEKIYESLTKRMTEVTVEQDLLANYGYDKIRSILGMDDTE